MSQHDDGVSLKHMLDHAREAVEMSDNRVREDLHRDRMLELSLIRLVEIVGESATRISLECQRRHQYIPWQQARGMRNRLIHGYDAVDLDVLWDTVRIDFPQLIVALQKAVNQGDL
ncbi:MAG: DUF86 domain-containing protein [Phycisphaerae bacterium]|nr:DUF86 domain-containing protein [Phycisphaerae bacterium]